MAIRLGHLMPDISWHFAVCSFVQNLALKYKGEIEAPPNLLIWNRPSSDVNIAYRHLHLVTAQGSLSSRSMCYQKGNNLESLRLKHFDY